MERGQYEEKLILFKNLSTELFWILVKFFIISFWNLYRTGKIYKITVKEICHMILIFKEL